MRKPTRYDYLGRRIVLRKALNVENEERAIISMYIDESLSAEEIRERIDSLGVGITARSIQRILAKHGKIRPIGDAFRLAASKGRVKWAYKDPAMKARARKHMTKTRYRILQRDMFKCVLCGATAKDDTLELDHIVAIVNGGTDSDDNLRILCHQCNVGKRIVERER